MTSMRYLLPILCAVLLSACGSDEQDGEPARKNSESAVTSNSSANKLAEPPAKVAPQEVAPALQPPAAETADKAKPAAPVKKAAERAKTEKKPQKVVQALPKTKLDLSLPKELLAQLDAENRAAEDGIAPILPAFFEEKKSSLNPFQLSGKLLTGETGTELSNSVEGAELHFEFRR